MVKVDVKKIKQQISEDEGSMNYLLFWRLLPLWLYTRYGLANFDADMCVQSELTH
jgi:hypothetical protein